MTRKRVLLAMLIAESRVGCRTACQGLGQRETLKPTTQQTTRTVPTANYWTSLVPIGHARNSQASRARDYDDGHRQERT
jgi:mitochondrial fission protein ELM1